MDAVPHWSFLLHFLKKQSTILMEKLPQIDEESVVLSEMCILLGSSCETGPLHLVEEFFLTSVQTA